MDMVNEVGIERAEYEERRSAFELCQWVNSKLRELEDGGDFDRQYFERIGKNVKRFVEEAIPLSRLGLYLSTPRSDVHVTCFADNRAYDGVIEITGFGARSFRVEVTTTDTPRLSELRRQALSRDGHVVLTGPIRREGRTILPEGAMVDVADEEERCIGVALERLRDKAASGRYGDDTVVLVYLTDCWLASLTELRAELLRRTEEYLRRERPPVHTVYYCYSSNYCVDHVAVRRA
jgi:hypothetical protein